MQHPITIAITGVEHELNRFALWLNKPAGVSYKDFYTALQPVTSRPGVALWGRQMTLGPTTEFCIHSPTFIELPPGYNGLQPQITRIIP